ncbi:hypothetical protein GCM10010172_16320 [Paractinoplanes ferrugineus]|uniref:Uncharacterized protein n=1 Tax=Paractinoplanes ferrugineus TaxID=113564 RepID=A0A919IW88_9ACTN|nr:hypothetical protein [Actinoplanes ferrugineus]GIE10196.1 hypothetical protein Afe05nite_20360 [Actinoplanes ferrugineus]
MLIGESNSLEAIACMLLGVLCAYGCGRIHQWYKHSLERDRSFREGYSHGYHALFAYAARHTGRATSLPKADRPRPHSRP